MKVFKNFSNITAFILEINFILKLSTMYLMINTTQLCTRQGCERKKWWGRYNSVYTCGKKEIHPYYISPIEMRFLRMEIKYIKSATRLLNRDWVNKGGSDLSKEVLWVSVGQRAAELRAVIVGCQQKCCLSAWRGRSGFEPGRSAEFFVDLQLWQPGALLPFDLQRLTVPL